MVPDTVLETTEEDCHEKKQEENMIDRQERGDEVCGVLVNSCDSSKGTSREKWIPSSPSSNSSSVNEGSLCRITDLSSTSLDVTDSPSLHFPVPDEVDHPEDLSRVDDMSSEKRIFRFARNRFKTFQENGWIHGPDISINELSEAGFFLRKERAQTDQVECAFCSLRVSDWKSDMDAFIIHSQRSPRCDFIMGYNVNNVPLDGNLASDPIRGPNRRTYFREPDVCGSTPSPVQSEASSPAVSLGFLGNPFLGVEEHRVPAFPDLVTLEARLRSYPQDWPNLCPVDSSRLAEAGFFYIGPIMGNDGEVIMDGVKCFHCSRIACNWDPSDDPWNEHKKHSQNNCYFLKLNFEKYRPKSPLTTETTSSSSPETVNLETSSNTSSGSTSCPTTTTAAADQTKETKSSVLTSIGSQLSSLASSFEKTTLASSGDRTQCKVCYSRDVEILFLPCRHAHCCAECASAVNKCPSCRAQIDGTVRIFL